MHLYIAGLYNAAKGLVESSAIYSRLTDAGKKQSVGIKNILESYHYTEGTKYPEQMRRHGHQIFLDSGAYSAFTKGISIELDEYAQFIKDNNDVIRMASVLDAIGDANETWRNQNKLEALGCQVIPCFHGGEPIDACRYYVANYPYISLGGMVGGATSVLKAWLDEVFTEAICDADGYAKCKVHGFGMTSLSLMERYPWYSVDSTSWVMTAAFGSLVFPEIKRPVAISDRSPSRKDLGQHYRTMSAHEQKYFHDLIDKYGLDLEACEKDFAPRYAFNAYAFHEIGVRMGEDHWRKPFKHRQRRLF